MSGSPRVAPTVEPRGLRLPQAAAYVGVSPRKFQEWVDAGFMPKPKRQGGVVVWDRFRLDESFEALPDGAGNGGEIALHVDTWADL